MWPPFSRPNFLAADESVSVSEWRSRERVSAVSYRRLIILLFAAAVWGLHEEDVKKRLRGLRPNAQLLHCPVCDRQKVVSSGATRVCRGHLTRRHPEEQMILLGQQG